MCALSRSYSKIGLMNIACYNVTSVAAIDIAISGTSRLMLCLECVIWCFGANQIYQTTLSMIIIE